MAEQVVCYKTKKGNIYERKEDAVREDAEYLKSEISNACKIGIMENSKIHGEKGISPILNYGFSLDTPIRLFIDKYISTGDDIFLNIHNSLTKIKEEVEREIISAN